MAEVRRIFLSTPGPQGDQGEQGPTGPAGADGTDANVQFVNHGADENTARPTGFDQVIWYGSVQPVNAIIPDIVIRTDESV